MDVRTAHNVIEQLNLSSSQKKELAGLLQGRSLAKGRPSVLGLEDAKRDFRNRLRVFGVRLETVKCRVTE